MPGKPAGQLKAPFPWCSVCLAHTAGRDRLMCGRVRQLASGSDDIVVSRTFLKLILDSIDRAEVAVTHAVQISSSARAAFEDLPCPVRLARVSVRQRFTAGGLLTRASDANSWTLRRT